MTSSSNAPLRWTDLGRVEYTAALELQNRIKAQVAEGLQGDTLLLLEHPPVITLGRSASAANVLVSDAELERRGIAKHQIGRGGDVTYHGPGQLVGYPIRRIGRAIAAHVRGISDALIALLGEHGIEGSWDARTPGVWTRSGKIAAVGVDARGGVATHGFALNIRPDLADYEVIVPCGLRQPVTSMKVMGVDPLPTLVQTAARLAGLLGEAYGVEIAAACPGELSRPAPGAER